MKLFEFIIFLNRILFGTEKQFFWVCSENKETATIRSDTTLATLIESVARDSNITAMDLIFKIYNTYREDQENQGRIIDYNAPNFSSRLFFEILAWYIYNYSDIHIRVITHDDDHGHVYEEYEYIKGVDETDTANMIADDYDTDDDTNDDFDHYTDDDISYGLHLDIDNYLVEHDY